MKAHFHFKKTLLSALVAGICAPYAAYANKLNLAQIPPGNVSVIPAPNVIFSLANAGSMEREIDGPNIAPAGKRRLDFVKAALLDVFNDKILLPDGKIRFAWTSGGLAGVGPLADKLPNFLQPTTVNAIKPLEDTHRAVFTNYVNNLGIDGDPVIAARFDNILKYLSRPLDVDSAWAAKPGIQAEPYLGCRRTYQILLTDGQASNYSEPSLISTTNFDSTSLTLPGPDHKHYDASSNETRVYRDNEKTTLSDWAFALWAKDHQPSIGNDIKPSTTDGVPAIENIGGMDIPKYWNPKHNPARWQHVVTHIIGFGPDSYKWGDYDGSGKVISKQPFWSLADDDTYGSGGDFAKLVNGTLKWPNVKTSPTDDYSWVPVDLWHAAINSRGRFYPTGAGRKNNLKDAFRNVVLEINRDNAPSATGSAGGASTNIRTGLNIYGAGYVPDRWSGYVKSNKLDTAGNVTSNTDWGIGAGGVDNTTASLLDARNFNTRVVLTTNDDAPNKGVSFEWDIGNTKLSAAQKTLLNADSKGQDRVNFLRGERSKENGTSFRVRDSVQGDIVNSGIWYVDAPASNYAFAGYKAFSSAHRDRLPMIYVGGNDGMLHGFSAVNGQEQIAYVPKGLIADLPQLSAPSYTHRYFVDGSPFTGDLKVGAGNAAADWRTYLVGTLAAGGKGYFVLDVTQPGNKSGAGSSTFTASNAASLVVLDRTMNASATVASGADEDIGHIFAPPVLDENNPFKATQIAKLNDDRWAVVMGNGYNSKNERPVLLIQYLDSTNEVNGVKELKRLVATGTQVPKSPVVPADANVVANGLSAPRLVDINSDGRMDVAYAGDLKGNLWKFDLTSKTAADWGVAVWGGTNTTPCTTLVTGCTPLFTASHAGVPQGITAAPTVKANDRGAGGLMVAFGTGVNFNDDDGKSTDVQSVYSVLDNTRYKLDNSGKLLEVDTANGVGAIPTVVTINDLVQQQLSSATAIAGQGKSSARGFWNVTQNNVTYVDKNKDKSKEKKGWYFNFPESRERMLKPMSFFDGSNNLMVFSTAPAFTGNANGEESCAPAGTNEKAYLTIMNIMDGKKPSVQVMDANGDGFYNNEAGKDEGVSRMTLSQGAISSVTGKKKITLSASDGKTDELASMPEQLMRPSWRQLQ